MSHQLSLFANETALPIPGWRGMTPPEISEAAPDGYHLDLGGEEPVDEADERANTDTNSDEAEADARFSPREWAPYCADTIALQGTIRKPASRLDALWVCTGSSGRASDRCERTAHVYRVVLLAEYASPHPDLPLSYREHNALPTDHPFRWGYEGMLVTWQRKPHVLTDEHAVFSHPYIPDPSGHGYLPDPDWYPNDNDAIRTDRNPWRDDPNAWQPARRLME
ncbi:MAG: hypothetical protein HYX53_05975 [Chloroflexi bacterium]|nr:hypothetical protein [Chloroflexota bacterium]